MGYVDFLSPKMDLGAKMTVEIYDSDGSKMIPIMKIAYEDGTEKYYYLSSDFPDLGGEFILDEKFKNMVNIVYDSVEILDGDLWERKYKKLKDSSGIAAFVDANMNIVIKNLVEEEKEGNENE